MSDDYFKRKSPMEREYERKEIERHNELLGVYLASLGLLILTILNTIGIVIGVFGIKKREQGIFVVVTSVIIGFIISVFYSIIANISLKTQVLNYLRNFYNLKEGKIEFIEFIYAYIFNPFFIIIFGLAVAGGAIAKSLYDSTSKEDYAKKESSKRINKHGEEVNFLEGLSFNSFIDEMTPEKYLKKVTNKDIEGSILGKKGRKEIYITDEEAQAHGMIVGTTGVGKTNLLLNFVVSCAERAKALFYIDGKGEHDLPYKIRKIAEFYGRKFYHFDITGEQSKLCYNPLYLGNPDNAKEKLMDTQNWSEEHYKAASSRTILFICKIIDQVLKETKGMSQEELRKEYYKKNIKQGEPIPRIKRDIICIQEMLTPSHLDKILRSIKDEELKYKWLKIQSKCNPDWYSGVEQRLALIAESALEELVIENGKGIRLTKIMDEKAIILFSLNALENADVTEMMGRLIVKDINTAISMKRNSDVVYALYDEHGTYISEDIGSQLAMARSYGLRVITSTQNISDYEKSRLGNILMRKIVGNTNFKIIMKQIEAQNAEYIAKNIGTQKNADKSISTDDMGKYTSMGIRNVEEFIVNPNQIKNLDRYEAIIIKKIPKQEVIKTVKTNYIDMKNYEVKNDEMKDCQIRIVENKINESDLQKKPRMGIRKKRDPLERRNKRLEKERENRKNN